MKFSDITGHETVIKSLREMVDTNKIPHAILLSGMEGIGKFRLARALSQYIHCRNKINGDSCGICPSCIQHQKLNNPDLHFIYPILKRDGALISKDYIDKWKEMLETFPLMEMKSWNDLIKAGNSQPSIFVNDSEWINTRASLSAYQEKYKIFLIWLPERMRQEAANKILKIIEEPFEDTIFIFVSNEEAKILPTIFSRTQRFNLSPLSEKNIYNHLIRNKGVDRSIAESVAEISEGSLSRAESLACNPEELNDFSDIFKNVMRNSWKSNLKSLKEYSEKIASFGREKNLRLLDYFSHSIRENYIYNFKIPNLTLMTTEEKEFSNKFSPFINEKNIEKISDIISSSYNDIERNGNAKIIMFDMFLDMATLIKSK